MLAKRAAQKWRESASLILLSKRTKPANKFDYDVLLFTRPESSSFMPNAAIFPGGVHEAIDESAQWLEHFKSFGVDTAKLQELTHIGGTRPPIFNSTNGEGELKKEISLRITAIRETFEEVGILFGRNRKSLLHSNGYGQLCADFDRKHWQHVVHNDSTKFLTLCKELNVIPDLWSLHEWSVWLTPSNFKKRFETAFYLVAVESVPNILTEKTEVKDFSWRTPSAYLTAYRNQELWLPPPQWYELSRLAGIPNLDMLRGFAKQRESKGTSLLLPVQYKCADGIVALLPGDDMYPDDPHACSEFIAKKESIHDFRAGAKKLHRAESSNPHQVVFQLNFSPPNGHLAPVNADP